MAGHLGADQGGFRSDDDHSPQLLENLEKFHGGQVSKGEPVFHDM